jgi:hypothetical protein
MRLFKVDEGFCENQQKQLTPETLSFSVDFCAAPDLPVLSQKFCTGTGVFLQHQEFCSYTVYLKSLNLLPVPYLIKV